MLARPTKMRRRKGAAAEEPSKLFRCPVFFSRDLFGQAYPKDVALKSRRFSLSKSTRLKFVFF
jgi:hypothetical protein